MPQPFETVREQLLRAGVAPRSARRYVTELREHLADLIERERATGLSVAQATSRALALMGTDADLARAMLDRGAPRSLATRAPWAMFAILPVALLAAVLGTAAFSMMHLLWPMRGLAPSQMPASYHALVELVSFLVTYLLGALLAAGCIAVAVRQRLASGWIWVGLGLIALLSGLLGFHVHVIPPQGGHRGGTIYSLAAIVYLHGRANLAATLGAWVLHAAVLFAIAATAYHTFRIRLLRLQG
jgi:hypothetical protein